MKKEFKIILKKTGSINSFLDKMNTVEGRVHLASAEYVINAKSLFGVMTMSMEKPIRLIFDDNCSDKDINRLMPDIKTWLAEDN